jgi:hypothetical protein
VKFVLTTCVLLALAGCKKPDLVAGAVPLKLDQEQRLKDQPLSASTQSVNRYRSVIKEFDTVDVKLDGHGRLGVSFREKGAPSDKLAFENIDARFLFPLLDYPHGKQLTPFDKANLMLAEYSRNGVELALQDQNDEYGYTRAHGLFNDDEEYQFQNGQVVPNPGARPKRTSLVNNCLYPGLWELNAADSVGEMYHAWMSLPEKDYFAMLRRINDFTATDEELHTALNYQKELPRIALELDKLRAPGRAWPSLAVAVNGDKPVASYSTQDSRRKVQRKFYRVERNGVVINPVKFADLQAGDLFQFYSFIPPGIYTDQTPRTVPYEPIWSTATLTEVTPKTAYPGMPVRHDYPLGALELDLRSQDGKRALVIGNLPIDLIVEQEDYDIPGFGVGVQRASEPIEKRYLFYKDGPAPVYAYSAFVRDGKLELANNHEQGLEQIYLRAVRRGDQVVLRITLVAYERIVDLLELEVVLPPELAAKVRKATAAYQRPLWRSFSDTNLL